MTARRAFTGRYEDFSLLSTQGGQGIACKATSVDGALVALKVYKPQQVEERNDREVTALRQLRGERIVRLHDAGRIEVDAVAYRFIATTFVDGRPLSDCLADPVSVRGAAQVIADVCDAIDELWLLKIVHRDIKPDNIIVTPAGRAVLIDLGIARHLSQKTLTTSGHTYGTHGYFAPEHIGGRPVTCKADVFSAGIVFQQMLIGSHPTNLDQRLLVNGGPRTATVAPNAPAEIVQLVDRMVAKRAFDRPAPATVRAVLESYLGRPDTQ